MKRIVSTLLLISLSGCGVSTREQAPRARTSTPKITNPQYQLDPSAFQFTIEGAVTGTFKFQSCPDSHCSDLYQLVCDDGACRVRDAAGGAITNSRVLLSVTTDSTQTQVQFAVCNHVRRADQAQTRYQLVPPAGDAQLMTEGTLVDVARCQ